MIKRLFLALIFLAVAFALLGSCAGANNANISAQGNASDPSGANSNTSAVHMASQNFVQTSVILAKGSNLKLIDDVSVPHHILNGSWHNGTVQSNSEAGAPSIDTQFSGSDEQTVGPFNVAGTYHLYCSYHPGMNLTITVR